MRKAGKTLLIKSFHGNILDETLFQELDGLEKKNIINDGKSVFLTFDTPQNALASLKALKEKSNELRIKFSYYKVFFTIDGLTDQSDYNTVKKNIMDYISNNVNANVLYCKLYCKNNKYIGCGDLTVDTLDGMIKLLSKENGLKDFKLDSYSGCFYKYNDKKIKQ
jgi:hypothetical protein